MDSTHILRELFAHNDWAREELMALSAALSDEQLDRKFEMGPGSLRETLRHLYGAERYWLSQWRGAEQTQFRRSRSIDSMNELWETWRNLAETRDADLDKLAENDLRRRIEFEGPSGKPHSFPLGDILLHVANHGVHHRAQALNMLRRVGVEKLPGLDYLFFRGQRPTLELPPEMIAQWRERGFEVADKPEPPAVFDLDTIREYYRYSDWANQRIHNLAADLSDEQLDRKFGMGVGTLRKTLTHVRDAEQWWCDHWIGAAHGEFHGLPQTTSIRELIDLTQQTADRRQAYFAKCSTESLQQPITVEPYPAAKLTVRLGESTLQLPTHGTHHRAQALNMLRRFGAEIPEMDYLDWFDETTGS